MGTVYYLYRPDTKTLFDFGKAYGLAGLLDIDDSGHLANLDEIEIALSLWLGEWPRDSRDVHAYANGLARAVRAFSDGKPVRFISEHHPVMDDLADEPGGVYRRITHDRHTRDFLAR